MSAREKSEEQYANYRFCHDNGHQQWVAKAQRCFRFWNGEQWDALVKARLEREGKPALTFNVIESLVRVMKGIRLALRNDVRYAPVQGADAAAARVQDQVWLHVQQQSDFDSLETEIYEKGLIMGRAYFDVRVDYSESFQGNIKLSGLRSQDVVLDPSVDTYDSDEWPQVFTKRWVSNNDIEHRFGKDAAEAVGRSPLPGWYDYEDTFAAHQMGRLPYYYSDMLGDMSAVRGHLLLSRQYYVNKLKEVFVDTATGDVSEIPESWDRNHIAHVLESVSGLSTMKKRMRTVRWRVTCESEVLHDDDSPYKRFTPVPYFPTFIDGVSKGAVESLLDPQQLYNKVTSQELHIINTTANSGYKVKTGALKNMTIPQLEQSGSRSGVVVELDDIGNLEKLVPNPIPQGHDRLSFKADNIMRSLAGVSNQSRGFAREDVAGEAIEMNMAAQDVNFAGWLSNLHRTKRLVARNVLDCVQAHFTETRVITINRGSVFAPNYSNVTINEPSEEGRVLNDVTQGKYSTVLVPAPARATLSEEDFKLLVMMREKLGIAIPDAMLIELSPASNKAQIIEALGGDSNERQRAAEEAALQQQQTELALTQAKAVKEQSAASLNQARAEKFAVEAATDPDAAYERVEQERIAAEKTQHEEKLQLEYARLRQADAHKQKDIAVELTQMDVDRELAARKATEDRKGLARKNKSGSPVRNS